MAGVVNQCEALTAVRLLWDRQAHAPFTLQVWQTGTL